MSDGSAGYATEHDGITAWPFLIGRGVTVGQSLLLVPEKMTRAEAMSLLDGVAAPPSGSDSVALTVSLGSYGVAYEPRVIGRAEIGFGRDGGTSGGGARHEPQRSEPLRDEHGRPMQVLYGFAVPDRHIDSVSPGDLAACWSQALAAYRRFHSDEDGYEIERSDPIIITSPTVNRRNEVGEGSFRTTSGFVESPDHRTASSDSSMLPSADGRNDRRMPARPWWSLPGVMFGLFAAIVVAVVVARSLDGGSSLFVDRLNSDCEVFRSDDGCLFAITSTSIEPVSIVAEVEPSSLASAFDVEADEACGAIDLETPCQVRVTADRGAIESEGGGAGIQLVVKSEGSDLTASVDLG